MSALRTEDWVVIPAFNEGGTLAGTIIELKRAGFKCLVVNDGSTDDTQASAAQADILLNHDVNRGYSAALQTGIHHLCAHESLRWLITLDADNQFETADVRRLIDSAEKESAGVAAGVRYWAEERDGTFVRGDRPAFQRFSERVTAFVLRKLCGLVDPLTGLKAFKHSSLEHRESMAGELTHMKLIVHAIESGIPSHQQGVAFRPRPSGESRFGNKFRAELAIFRSILGVLFLILKGRVT